MRRLLVATFVVSLVAVSRADSQLIPLVDPHDPLLITNAKIEFEGDVRPVAFVELENQTEFPVDVGDAWLHIARFYTRSEALANREPGRIKLSDCGRIGHVDQPHSQLIAPHARLAARIEINPDCEPERAHEHFFVTLERLQNYHAHAPAWKRDSTQFAQLLSAAQPHP